MQTWTLCTDDTSIVNSIAAALGISTLTSRVLYHRGITDPDSARRFFDPEHAQEFYDPFSMKGMTEAVERIVRAIERDERVVVYGDYDVDGMTASAVLIRTLRRLGARADSYIPNRQTEGYGFNFVALDQLAERYDLLISVDCGITNNPAIAAVCDRLDIIVTDHHLPTDPIRNAIAALDPHQPDCPYPDKNLCGAGVAFKLCQALNTWINGLDHREYVDDIELVALGTVADLVPLLGENRKIVRLGLARMTETSIVGLRALIKVSGLEGKKINAGHCGFSLGPRLNAVGRLESASLGLDLLLTKDHVKARLLALKLDQENRTRKEIEADMLREADEEFQRLRTDVGGGLSSIVLAREGWHRGVIGLTASKLLERYYLPTIVIALEDDLAVGSCRSIGALNMKDALDRFADRFEHYGGHAAAAGFSMARSAVEQFALDFDEYVRGALDARDFIPKQKLDVEIHPTEIDLGCAEELERLAPFGIGNPHPRFGCRGVRGFNGRKIGSAGQHLSFEIEAALGRYGKSAVDDAVESEHDDGTESSTESTTTIEQVRAELTNESATHVPDEKLSAATTTLDPIRAASSDTNGMASAGSITLDATTSPSEPTTTLDPVRAESSDSNGMASSDSSNRDATMSPSEPTSTLDRIRAESFDNNDMVSSDSSNRDATESSSEPSSTLEQVFAESSDNNGMASSESSNRDATTPPSEPTSTLEQVRAASSDNNVMVSSESSNRDATESSSEPTATLDPIRAESSDTNGMVSSESSNSDATESPSEPTATSDRVRAESSNVDGMVPSESSNRDATESSSEPTTTLDPIRAESSDTNGMASSDSSNLDATMSPSEPTATLDQVRAESSDNNVMVSSDSSNRDATESPSESSTTLDRILAASSDDNVMASSESSNRDATKSPSEPFTTLEHIRAESSDNNVMVSSESSNRDATESPSKLTATIDRIRAELTNESATHVPDEKLSAATATLDPIRVESFDTNGMASSDSSNRDATKSPSEPSTTLDRIRADSSNVDGMVPSGASSLDATDSSSEPTATLDPVRAESSDTNDMASSGSITLNATKSPAEPTATLDQVRAESSDVDVMIPSGSSNRDATTSPSEPSSTLDRIRAESSDANGMASSDSSSLDATMSPSEPTATLDPVRAESSNVDGMVPSESSNRDATESSSEPTTTFDPVRAEASAVDVMASSDSSNRDATKSSSEPTTTIDRILAESSDVDGMASSDSSNRDATKSSSEPTTTIDRILAESSDVDGMVSSESSNRDATESPSEPTATLDQVLAESKADSENNFVPSDELALGSDELDEFLSEPSEAVLPADEKIFLGVDEHDEFSDAFSDFDAQHDFFEDFDEDASMFSDIDGDAPDVDADALVPSIVISSAVDDTLPAPQDYVPLPSVRAVAWNMGSMLPLLKTEPIDLVFEPSINEYNDTRSVQCVISSLEPTGSPNQFPDRNTLGRIYKFLRTQSKNESVQPFDLCRLTDAFRRSTMASERAELNSIFTMHSAIKVFAELGLIRFDADGSTFFMPIPKRKLDLNRSRIFTLNTEGDAHE